MDEGRRKKLLARVGKMLRQAEGTTYESEAYTALAMAQRILLEHGLTMAEVDALSDQEQQQLVANEVIDDMGAVTVDWKWQLAYIIAKNFRCDAYITSKESLIRRTYPHRGWTKKRVKSLRFIGLTEDLIVARDVYQCARDVAEKLSRLYVKDRYVVTEHLNLKLGWLPFEEYSAGEKAAASREIRVAWIGGFIIGLREQFRRQVVENPSMAVMLVIHPVVKSAIANLKLEQTGYKSRVQYGANSDARLAGYEAGRAFHHSPTKRLHGATPRLPEEQ